MCTRLVYCALVCLGSAPAQTARHDDLLLKTSIQLSGTVTDSSGNPLSGVSIYHSGTRAFTPTTNDLGRFKIDTRAPAIVFRKAGFNAKYYRTEQDAVVNIALEPAADALKTCPSSSRCLSLDVFLAAFCLVKVHGVEATRQGNDIDYVQRQFLIRTPRGIGGIQHAAGPLWGSGLPLDEDVWSAIKYEERDYLDRDGFQVLDARGTYPNGNRWRVLGRAFETASYRNLPVVEARVLDRVLDSVCLRLQ